MTAEDHSQLLGLFVQPGVRRFIFDDEILSSRRAAEIIQQSVTLFARHRYGLWLARLRTDSDPIGFGAFWWFRNPPELELLYGVGDEHAKKGYGREIAKAVVTYGFEVLKMPAIRASTDPSHADSRRLLEEMGFVFERQQVVGGLDTVFYELRGQG